MATVEIGHLPAAKPAPTSNTHKRHNKADALKGVKRNYRSVAGKSYDDTEAIKAKILELIETKPRAPVELRRMTAYSRMQIWRYCDDLAKDGKIEKQGQLWVKKSATRYEIAQQITQELTDDDFGKLPIMKPWVEKLDGKSRYERNEYNLFRNICLGRYIDNFKINPENWQFKETTKAFADAYRKAKAKDRVSYDVRQAVREFLGTCLGINLRENPYLNQIEMDGGKDNMGAHATVMLSDEDIDRACDFFADDLEMRALIAFNMEAIPRAERGLVIELNDVEFSEEAIEQAILHGHSEAVRDPEQLKLLHALALALPDGKIKFENIKRRICSLKHLETKTGDTWATYIITPRLLQAAEEWVAKRRKAGMRYTFYDGKQDTNKSQEGYILHNLAPKRGYYEKLRALYKHLGKTDSYMYEFPMYALRHCGAQLMLRRTNYDYDYVADHGWNDTATLKKWYGQRGKASLKDKLLHR